MTPRVIFGGWMPELAEGGRILATHGRDLDSVSLFAYGVTVTGGLNVVGQGESPATLALLRKLHITSWMTIGGTPPELPGAYRGAAAQRTIDAIVDRLTRLDYDGVDLDWEGIDNTSRSDYTAFVVRLAAAVHHLPRPRRLAVTVQDFPSAQDEASMAFDYAALGEVADEVRVMLYDYSTDKPGPIMPHDWFTQDVTFAASRIPRGKFIAALPWYGRDWDLSGTGHEDLMWSQTKAGSGVDGFAVLLERHGAATIWDEPGGEYHFSYTVDGKPHEVWMPEARKFAWMADQVMAAGAAGIYVWHLAWEPAEVWPTVRAIRRTRRAPPAPPPAPSATTPVAP